MNPGLLQAFPAMFAGVGSGARFSGNVPAVAFTPVSRATSDARMSERRHLPPSSGCIFAPSPPLLWLHFCAVPPLPPLAAFLCRLLAPLAACLERDR